jgi:hypothetical protein
LAFSKKALLFFCQLVIRPSGIVAEALPRTTAKEHCTVQQFPKRGDGVLDAGDGHPKGKNLVQ